MRDYAIVLSNDVENPERMLEVTKMVAPFVDGIKIGITSSMVPSIDIYKRAKEAMGNVAMRVDIEDVQQLADYKVADIGFKNKAGLWEGTNEKIIRNLSEAGANYITVHTFPGLSSIEEAVQTAHKHGSKVLTLPYMTHKGADMFFAIPVNLEQKEHFKGVMKKYGIDENEKVYSRIDNARTVSDIILVIGDYYGADGFIGPANKPDILNRYRSQTTKEIWSPGFGRQDDLGRSLEHQMYDWAKIVGPNSAMIVGSLIYAAEDPAKAAREVMETRDRVVQRL